MKARQTGSGLKMLAAGLVLGHLALRKPRSPAPVVVRIAEPGPKPKRKWDFLTNNAVVAGIVSAIVAGAISLMVAHDQIQDTHRQANASQQAAVADRIETDASRLYRDGLMVADHNISCAEKAHNNCVEPDAKNPVYSDLSALQLIENNVTNSDVGPYLGGFIRAASVVIEGYDSSLDIANGDETRLVIMYNDLLFECGQAVIQDQSS